MRRLQIAIFISAMSVFIALPRGAVQAQSPAQLTTGTLTHLTVVTADLDATARGKAFDIVSDRPYQAQFFQHRWMEKMGQGAQIGVAEGAAQKVRQGRGEAVLTAMVDAAVPAGVIRIAAAHSSTCGLEGLSGPIAVEPL